MQTFLKLLLPLLFDIIKPKLPAAAHSLIRWLSRAWYGIFRTVSYVLAKQNIIPVYRFYRWAIRSRVKPQRDNRLNVVRDNRQRHWPVSSDRNSSSSSCLVGSVSSCLPGCFMLFLVWWPRKTACILVAACCSSGSTLSSLLSFLVRSADRPDSSTDLLSPVPFDLSVIVLADDDFSSFVMPVMDI